MALKNVSKEDLLHEGLSQINHHTTRHRRGTNDQQYLLNDLERIEQIVGRCLKILASDKEIYSPLEHEKIHLDEFKSGIKKAFTKKK